MNLIKIIFRWGLYASYLLLTTGIVLEVIFRVLPTSDSLQIQPVNENNPIIHFKENRTVTKQSGFNFTHVNEKNINNFGYATDTKFLTKDLQKNKVVAVIGDSFVEAVQVSNEDTFHALLGNYNDDISVYPIGVNGASLAQYIAFTNYAETLFDPDIYIFILTYNDFDHSWIKIRKAPGYHYFTNNSSLELVPYKPSYIKELARKSAFIRYLYLDLKIEVQISRIQRIIKGNDNPNLKIDKNFNELRKELGMKAADIFMSKMKELSQKKKIIIVTDGDRSEIYEGKLNRDADSYDTLWFESIINQAQKIKDIHLIDLHPIFLSDWQKDQRKFNYENNGHWSKYGHKVVSDVIDIELKNLLKE